MKILFLSYHFPPDSAVGAVRPAKVVQAFCSAGHEVVVVTAALPGDSPRTRSDQKGLKIRTISPWANPRDWYAAAKGVMQKWKGGAAEESVRGINKGPVREPGATLPAWKRWIFSLIWLPDPRQGFIPPAVWSILKEGQCDLVYTSGPPFSVHLAGLVASTLKGCRWVAEFRDPWTDNPWKPWHARSAFSDFAEKKLELWCLRAADLVVCVTAGICRGFEKRLTVPERGKLLVSYNGIDNLQPAGRRTHREGPRVVLHLGTLYHKRDPRPFLDALQQARITHKLTESVLSVQFVGNCRWFGEHSLEEETRRRNLSDLVQIRDSVPKDEVAGLLDRADVLLLLAQEQPDQVPNKLYEYLGTRKPILAWLDDDGETARILRQVGGHYLVTSEETSGRALEGALGISGSAAPARNEEALQSLRTGSQIGKVLAALEG